MTRHSVILLASVLLLGAPRSLAAPQVDFSKIKEPALPGAASYRHPPAPRIADLALDEARRAVDVYAARVTEVIDSMTRFESKDATEDRLDAGLDDIQDLLAQGKLAAAADRLTAFEKELAAVAKERGKALRTRAFKAVIRSHTTKNTEFARIPDRATFERLAFQGDDGLIEPHLRGTQYVKFWLSHLQKGRPRMHFFDTNVFRSHKVFIRAAGLKTKDPRGANVPDLLGSLCYRPWLRAPDGTRGLYTFEFDPHDTMPFRLVKLCHDRLLETAPLLRGRLAYHPLPASVETCRREETLYREAKLHVVYPRDLYGDVAFLPLNRGTGYGRLRLMKHGERPTPRDVVIYPTLPNEMPRVAGVITGERQTPLSHVNLRAVQDRVPNAYVRDAAGDAAIRELLGKDVHYEVTDSSYTLREATPEEVERHHAATRPKVRQVPALDLTAKHVRALRDIAFADAKSVGAKAASVAALGKLGLPEGTVPEGFAVPFSFYRRFMRHNGLDAAARSMRAAPGFGDEVEARRKALARFRTKITAGSWPKGLRDALGEVQGRFARDARIRCRSSTNNEDLPGFSGAGLYDSYTHQGADTHLAETIKAVYASLWNFRAFEEREFWRVDHDATAMGVLLHRSFRGEKANGVAVTDDILYGTPGRYYVNVQVGEDMVTNPAAGSIAEEVLLDPIDAKGDVIVRLSNRTKDGARVLTAEHTDQLRRHLGRIHRKFRRLHEKPRRSGRFAIEVEFKITADGRLAIKQARPWVY